MLEVRISETQPPLFSGTAEQVVEWMKVHPEMGELYVQEFMESLHVDREGFITILDRQHEIKGGSFCIQDNGMYVVATPESASEIQ